MSTPGSTHIRIAGPHRWWARTPAVTAAVGFAVYALAMAAGEVFELNADDHTAGAPDDPLIQAIHLPEMGIGLVGAAIAVWVASSALSGSTTRIDRYAIGLAAVAAASFVIFWAGWPNVFGAVSVGLALEQRRRLGSFSGLSVAAIVLGSAALVAGTVTCVFG
jgi:hypothetical protein